jgi:hypothetical protein
MLFLTAALQGVSPSTYFRSAILSRIMTTLARLSLPILLLACSAASAEGKTETRWLKVLLQGQQIGQVEHSRRVVGDTVINTERGPARR